MPFNSSVVKIFARPLVLSCVIICCYFIGNRLNFLFHSTNSIGGIWCAVSAIIVFDELPHTTGKLTKDRFLRTLIGAFVSILCMYFSLNLICSVGLSLFITGALLLFFKWDGAFKIGCITALMISITTHGLSMNAIWQTGLLLSAESALGGIISLFATILVKKIKHT